MCVMLALGSGHMSFWHYIVMMAMWPIFLAAVIIWNRELRK
jgi:hypothetical protein